MKLVNEKKHLLLKYLKIGLKQGKKEKIEKLIKLSFSRLKQLEKINPLVLLLDAIKKAQPYCEIKSLKVKGSVKKIPIGIKQKRQKSLVLRWIITNTFIRAENELVEQLAKELLETSLLQSKTIKTCDDLHKTVEVNKTFTLFKN